MADEKSAFYREALLEHARHPRHRGRLEAPHLSASASNPLCGDELELTLRLTDGNIAELGMAVRGCTIVQAAASLISEAIAGVNLKTARALGAAFREAMEGPREAIQGGRETLPEGLESLEPLIAVRQHRSRIRCALLPWDALDACERDQSSG